MSRQAHLLVPNQLHAPLDVAQGLLHIVEALLASTFPQSLNTVLVGQRATHLLRLILQCPQTPACFPCEDQEQGLWCTKDRVCHRSTKITHCEQ